MSEFFLTNPHTPVKGTKVNNKAYIRFKEQVSIELQNLNVPFVVADLAVIDLGYMMKTCRIGYKHTPRQAAEYLLPRINEVYKNEDGTWHYAESNTPTLPNPA